MKNFLFGLKEYLKDECYSVGFKVTPSINEVIIPRCIRKNEFLNAFFAGTNVSAEEITTFHGFKYKASVSTKKYFVESEMEEVKKMLSKGLKAYRKQGRLNYNLNSEIKIEGRECNIFITLSPLSRCKLFCIYESMKEMIQKASKKTAHVNLY